MARKVKTRQQNAPIPTIIGAGITEQWYFTHLQRILGYRVKVRPRFFGQEDIFQLTKKVESVIQDGGVAIAVFNADVASWDEKERIKLDAFRKKYGKNENVIICFISPTSIDYSQRRNLCAKNWKNSLTDTIKTKNTSAARSGCDNFANQVI